MPGPFTVDASVFLNAFNPAESGSETSREVLSKLQAQAVPLIAPTLLLPETVAAIRRGQNNPELARQFAVALSRLPYLILIPLDEILAHRSLEVASSYSLRGSDAVYVAVAQRFASPLVTLDREQHDRAASALKTYYPGELLLD